MTKADLVRWIAAGLGLRYNEVGDKAFLALPEAKPAPKPQVIPSALAVPYFAQMDSATSQGRACVLVVLRHAGQVPEAQCPGRREKC